ncbi:MAG TPA: phenylalanine--tRNA ligase subunit alpha [Terriglobales bacterium]|jgi:phenylalanyl-tRNA synthetase alpha chain|nr:phenylalanine--tRNA ligase subunit alpha [Terriglobales bacterium]
MYTVPKLDDYSPEALERAVAQLVCALDEEAREVSDESSWKEFRDRWMARKNGVLTQVNDLWLKAAPGPQKREVGRRVNEVKAKVEAVVEQTRERVSGAASDDKLRVDRVDVTLPGIRRPLGAEHPIIRTMNDIIGVFKAMGYSVAEGPEIETDYYNFESLNFPPNHPARDMQDTIFLAGQEQKPARDRLLLRTHTSPVQIRTMEKQKPPVRVVIPGRVYRNDAPDATHSPMFHQVEGLAVDTNITFCDLKGSLDHAMKSLFGSSVKTRFRPSFFPFTEPSAEVLISCIFCGGGYQGAARCPNCKASGWIELLGSGMVDPALYGFVGYDAEKYSGFAFGMGVDRIAAMLYGVTDLQLFFNGDVRFLEQFA